jgi:hypothetical protein
MISLEQEIKNFFNKYEIPFIDNTASYDELDFVIKNKSSGDMVFHLDVKEKTQKYIANNWPKIAPEPYLFIIDDLAFRKFIVIPKSGLLIRDNIQNKYFFLRQIDLAYMQKVRVNRTINKNQIGLKGKIVFDLRNGTEIKLIKEIIPNITHYLQDLKGDIIKSLKCYGNYIGEEIKEGGTIRDAKYWAIDRAATK